ncbi:MAG TPA: DUF4332 domain-containing protein [Caldilineaceae bacterium]|nr:DUF4332 domain-containing protein [Caldilineaceae bacterium]
MKVRVDELKGVTDEITAALKRAGIADSEQLLTAGGHPKGRAELAAKLGVSERAVLELVNRADLSRVHGVAGVYSDLLEFAGVDTVAELRRRIPENLHLKILEKASKHEVKRTPRLDEVQSWIEQAKQLERAIYY